MNDLRIVFMGTPDFAVGILDALLENGHTIVGVITAPDRPAGRGRKLNLSAVKKYALEQQLPILQPTNLKHPDFIKELEDLKANLHIVVAFRMLPKIVWQMPEYGTFNLHASLLPEYRGAAPINWAIINGEKTTGVTTFFIDDKIDTGAMILQEEIPILPEDSAGTLHNKLMLLGADIVLKTVERIKTGHLETTVQNNAIDLKPAHKIHKDTCKINWNLSKVRIYDFIRGLCPYPTAWTTLYNGDEQLTMKIYRAEISNESHSLRTGQLVFNKSEIKVAVKGGYINLLEIQLQGKRRMFTKDVLNGLKLSKNAYVG
ncbi:methionyl-tRNA formyltransferase [Maribacter sp. 2304DJ31-5]|uniref:methionyl-tRNA formyltransferase n=1 Tax=Maribacter sp. 2304DJ31-5 TaxID=3386273 RepID=UPI0039BCD90D